MYYSQINETEQNFLMSNIFSDKLLINFFEAEKKVLIDRFESSIAHNGK